MGRKRGRGRCPDGSLMCVHVLPVQLGLTLAERVPGCSDSS